MGIALGDFNRDGLSDLVYTNYAAEVNILAPLVDNESSNDGVLRNAVFTHDFDSPLVHKLSWPKVSWGTGLFDLDNDVDLDLFFSAGHLNSVSGDNRQSNLLFENDGRGRFSDISEPAGILATGKRIHRAAVFADYDNDGKMDIYVTNNGQQVEDGKGNTIDDPYQGVGILYRNESASKNNWLKVRLEGTKSNRDAFGTVVKLTTGDATITRALVSGAGYFSAHARELHFGLGQNERVDKMEITWPSGEIQAFREITPNQTVYVVEGGTLHRNTLILGAN
jgi:hypothetical protein